MRRIAFAASLASLGTAAHGAPLTFNGVDGKSTIVAVKARFPTAEQKRMPCKPDEVARRYANGVTRCDYVALRSYKLGGYDFEVSFFFAESGGLKTIALRWPRIELNAEQPSQAEIENAYWALVDMYVGKYGRYVSQPPCSYLVKARCQEWQMDDSTEWHSGGERIEIEYETSPRSAAAVSIKYNFASRDAFDRF